MNDGDQPQPVWKSSDGVTHRHLKHSIVVYAVRVAAAAGQLHLICFCTSQTVTADKVSFFIIKHLILADKEISDSQNMSWGKEELLKRGTMFKNRLKLHVN